LRVRLRHSKERAQQVRCVCLSRRHVGQEGAGGVRHRYGLQPHGDQRGRGARTQQAHRLHAGRGEGACRSRLRLHDRERRGLEGMVGQGAHRLSLDPSPRTRTNEERGGSLLMASTLLMPATCVVVLGLLVPILILLRYSFNKFDPRLMMLEAVTLENYVKFFTDPFYTNVFWTTLRVALLCTLVCLVLAFPLAYVLARSESRH